MSDVVRPPDEPGEQDEGADEPMGDPEVPRPPTPYERLLVQNAGNVVPRCATWYAHRFPRIVRETGLLTVDDLSQLGHEALYRAARVFDESKSPRIVDESGLLTVDDLNQIGHDALYRAARVYDEKENPQFAAFARYYVRGAMLNAIDDLLFEERVKQAAAIAADQLLGSFVDREYNVMKHDEHDARRRFRSFANGVLAATLAAGVEAARGHLEVAELAERSEYEEAIAIVDRAMSKLAEPDRQLLALVYGAP